MRNFSFLFGIQYPEKRRKETKRDEKRRKDMKRYEKRRKEAKRDEKISERGFLLQWDERSLKAPFGYLFGVRGEAGLQWDERILKASFGYLYRYLKPFNLSVKKDTYVFLYIPGRIFSSFYLLPGESSYLFGVQGNKGGIFSSFYFLPNLFIFLFFTESFQGTRLSLKKEKHENTLWGMPSLYPKGKTFSGYRVRSVVPQNLFRVKGKKQRVVFLYSFGVRGRNKKKPKTKR